jgi:hypothetical protein
MNPWIQVSEQNKQKTSKGLFVFAISKPCQKKKTIFKNTVKLQFGI